MPPQAMGHIVGREAAAFHQFGVHIFKILGISFLVGIGKNKIKRAWKLFYQSMGIGQPGINKVFDPSPLEVFQGCFMPVLIDFNGDQLTPGLAQCPGNPYGGMPGRGANIPRPFYNDF